MRRLELLARRRLGGLVHGTYQGLQHGTGTQPGDARTYQPGDDVRRIDWNLTARTTITHVRDTIAEHELEAWFVADVSASMRFGTALYTKHELVVAAATALGVLIDRPGNRAGGVLSGGEDPTLIPARSGRRHLLATIHRIATASTAAGAARLGDAVDTVSRVARRRSLVVVLSDFLGDPGWTARLPHLAERHDLMAVEVVDPRELTLPNVGVLTLVDPETGCTRRVQTASPRLRRRYRAAAHAQRATHAATFAAVGASHLVLRTDEDWLVAVADHVRKRRRRPPAALAGRQR